MIESNEPAPAPAPVVAAPAAQPAPVTAPAARRLRRLRDERQLRGSGWRCQRSDPGAEQYQQRLSKQFGVPCRVEQNGAVWRIQMGPFASKSQAASLQQRLQSEAQLQSFIAVAK